jgi:hypothetical protein
VATEEYRAMVVNMEVYQPQMLISVVRPSARGLIQVLPWRVMKASSVELPASFITINGIKAEQRSGDCTDEDGSIMKIKGYAFATTDDTIIMFTLSSNSTNEYNQYLPQFEESVKTIKIEMPGDIATSELHKRHKELEIQTIS